MCTWVTAYLRGVNLMLEPASKVASLFVKPCRPEEARQAHCLGPAATQTISLTLLCCECMHHTWPPSFSESCALRVSLPA